MTRLVRAIGLPSATALVVGTILGSSIFVQSSEITAKVPSVSGVMLAWMAAGLLTLIGALVCAELSSAFPKTGGVYVFFREIYSPLLGFIFGTILMIAVAWIFRGFTPWRVDKWFRRLQLVSASFYSLGHGGNDAQKTIGIIWMLLIAAGVSGSSEPVPLWVVIACYAAIGLGTMFGGWRIVKTMGQRITKLRPVGGFCAETGGAITLFLATGLGIPVSTTHTITGAIVGVGAVQKFNAVRWGVAGNIVWAWIFTIPASAFVAAVAWWMANEYLPR